MIVKLLIDNIFIEILGFSVILVFNNFVSKLNHCEVAPEGGGEVKIEVERGVITFSSLCIENTTPIFCTEIVAVLQLGNNHSIN